MFSLIFIPETNWVTLKNSGCISLLCSHHLWYSEVTLSRVRLFMTPWTVAYQTPLSMGFSRQEYWSWLPFPSPGDLPDPGIEPGSPALQANTLPSEHCPTNSNQLQFSSVQSLSHVRLFVTTWIAARQASLSITISWSSLKLTSI